LDDPLVRTLAQEDPALFFQRFPPPVLIDEIQYAPDLHPYIKIEVDRQQKPGLFWLTGSQQFHLMKGVSESLAGRVGIIQLLGLSQQEMNGIGLKSTPFIPTREVLQQRLQSMSPRTLKELYQMIWIGSYPGLALHPKFDRDLYYSSYVQTYLQRDISDLARVGDQLAFFRFLKSTAARSSQLLNMTDLARDVDVSPNTVKNWLSILQASGIIYLLEPYHTNSTKRLVKSPKLFFLDTGLCAWLTEWSSPETLEAGAMAGPILETWVFGEILKSWWHHGFHAPLYFYRDKTGREIDLLIIRDGAVYPLEIKKTASPKKEMIQSFHVLDDLRLTIGPGGVICLASEYLPLTENTSIIPVWAI
jgi:predicted AAA+ superfamily ATPase